MRRVVRCGVTLAAFCASGCLVAHAQQPEPLFRVSSELVVIDLVAVDRQGRLVPDLRPDDIEVKEDGKRQAVQLLRLVGQPSSPAGPSPAATTTIPTSSTPSSPSAAAAPGPWPTRRLAIVVDTLSLTVDAVPRVRQSLLATIADIPEDLPVLIATIGPDLHITQPFTTDKALLRQAVSALPTQLDPPAGVARVFNAIDRMCAAAVDEVRVLATAIEAGEQMVTDAQARSDASSEALTILADRLGALTGRKHLVLYSSGHAISPVTQAIDAVGAAVAACTGQDAMVVRREASSALGRLTNRAASEGLRAVIERANRAPRDVLHARSGRRDHQHNHAVHARDGTDRRSWADHRIRRPRVRCRSGLRRRAGSRDGRADGQVQRHGGGAAPCVGGCDAVLPCRLSRTCRAGQERRQKDFGIREAEWGVGAVPQRVHRGGGATGHAVPALKV